MSEDEVCRWRASQLRIDLSVSILSTAPSCASLKRAGMIDDVSELVVGSLLLSRSSFTSSTAFHQLQFCAHLLPRALFAVWRTYSVLRSSTFVLAASPTPPSSVLRTFRSRFRRLNAPSTATHSRANSFLHQHVQRAHRTTRIRPASPSSTDKRCHSVPGEEVRTSQ